MDYRQAFDKEVYALMREAFEESLTPGSDNIKTPKTPVMMKPEFYRTLAGIAVSKLARAGMKKPSDFDVEWEAGKIYASGGSEVKNPSTPKVPPELYNSVPFFRSFFAGSSASLNRRNPGTPDAGVDLFQQFKSTHMHMAGLYLRQKLGLKENQFEFPKGASAEQRKEILLNQYRRYTIAVVILSLIQLAFEINRQQIDEIMDSAGVLKATATQLDTKRNREGYMNYVGGLMREVFGGQNLGAGILRKFRKKLT